MFLTGVVLWMICYTGLVVRMSGAKGWINIHFVVEKDFVFGLPMMTMSVEINFNGFFQFKVSDL